MKKITIAVLFLIVAGVLVYRFFTPSFSPGSTSSLNDTVLVKQYCESAKELRHNNPDSAIIEYQKAIQLLESIPGNDRVKHLLADTYIDLSYLYILKGDYGQQREYAQKGLSVAGRNNQVIRARVLFYEGLAYYNQGEFDSALSSYYQADSLAKQTGEKVLEAKLSTNIAIITHQQGDHEKAIDAFLKTEAIGIELNDEELIAGSYVNMGVVYTGMRDFEKAKDVYAKAIESYSRNNKDVDLASALMHLGNVYNWQENYSEALDYYQQSLALNIKTGNKPDMGRAYNNLGEVYRVIGDLDHALEMYYNSLKIKEEISNKAGMATTHRALAGIYFNQKNYSKSLEYYQKALKTDSTLNIVDNMAIGYANIATIYKEYKKYETALDYALKSVELFKQTENAWGESEAYQLLGAVYQDRKEYDLALMCYRESLAQKLDLSFDGQGLGDAYLMLSDFYLKKPGADIQDIHHAERYGLSAYNIADSLKLHLLTARSSEILAQIYERQQNPRQAVRFLKINKQANDTLFNKSKAEALVFAEARWNDEKRQREIRYLEEENQSILTQKEEQHKRHQLLLYGLIIIFSLIALTAVLLWKYKHKQREMRIQQQLSQIAVLRMQNIQNHISPHFMFNVLNSVVPGLREHAELSRPMRLLVDSIRGSLSLSEKLAITLEEEVKLVKNYLALVETMNAGMPEIRWEIPSGTDLQTPVPSMILQIPVENAVKYAFDDHKEGNLIAIGIFTENQLLHIEVQDNGIGFNAGRASDPEKGTGTGLKTLYKTIEMLNAMNNKKIEFEMKNEVNISADRHGTGVFIKIPTNYKYEL